MADRARLAAALALSLLLLQGGCKGARGSRAIQAVARQRAPRALGRPLAMPPAAGAGAQPCAPAHSFCAQNTALPALTALPLTVLQPAGGPMLLPSGAQKPLLAKLQAGQRLRLASCCCG